MSTVKAINLQHPTAANANIVLNSSGNIGIGTATPTAGRALTLNSANNYYGIDFQYNGTSQVKMIQEATGSLYVDYNETNASGALNFRKYGGLNVLKLDSSGYVTKPYQPSFFVRSGTTGGSGSSGTAVYVFTDVEHNTGSHYSTSTGRFTAPIAGRYLMMSGVLSRSGTGMNLNMRKNGSNIAVAEDSRSGGYGEANITIIANLAAGDYIDIYPNNAAYGGQYDWFSGYLIG